MTEDHWTVAGKECCFFCFAVRAKAMWDEGDKLRVDLFEVFVVPGAERDKEALSFGCAVPVDDCFVTEIHRDAFSAVFCEVLLGVFVVGGADVGLNNFVTDEFAPC